MGLQNLQNQKMNLVLSTDAKPRLKWTPELHQRFVDAVIQLGGAEKATPKSVMKAMGIPGITLYHLKSHLQKYRLGKNQPTEEACSDYNQDDRKDSKGSLDLLKNWKIAQAIHAQMEVQRKLQEQIEVQKRLQLRIEAQGKYLQKVLKKAQETLSSYTPSSMEVERAKAELSQLVTMVNSGCSSPSLSDLTEERPLRIEDLDNETQIKGHGCSTESSLTSFENSGAKEDMEVKIVKDEVPDNLSNIPFVFELLDQTSITRLTDQVLSRKRKGSSISEGSKGDKEACKKLSTYKEHMGLFGRLDLNMQYQEDQNLGETTIDMI